MPAPDLARLWADDAVLNNDTAALMSRLVQFLQARMMLRRERPDAAQRRSEEDAIAKGIDAIFGMLVLTCEQRLVLREAIDAATPPTIPAHGGAGSPGSGLH